MNQDSDDNEFPPTFGTQYTYRQESTPRRRKSSGNGELLSCAVMAAAFLIALVLLAMILR